MNPVFRWTQSVRQPRSASKESPFVMSSSDNIFDIN